MRFSPLLVPNLIILPLRYFFNSYPVNDLYWDQDVKKSKMDIGHINDYNKIALQTKPRILVNRGNYVISGTGLSENLAQAKTMAESKGLEDRINMVLIEGEASIILESRNEGAIELLTDTVTHFLTWTRPYISETQGFLKYGQPMQVSAPQPGKEDKEIFQVLVSFPYLMEEQWKIKSDALKLNQFFMDLKPFP
jgi:hypothetical protein